MLDDRKPPSLRMVTDYWDQGLPGQLAVIGFPTVWLAIDSRRRSLALRAVADDQVPRVVDRQSLSTHAFLVDGQRFFELAVDVTDNLADAYDFLLNVADRMQLERMTFNAAVTDAIDAFGAILARGGRLTTEQEVGLVGELLLLRSLLLTTGEDAVGAWTGPLDQEHDFRLPDQDIEVKSTQAEQRIHWISSLTQLLASPDRPLHLLSIQLTTGAPGVGSTLSDVLDAALQAAGDQAGALHGLIHRLFPSLDASLYSARWSLRSTPMWFDINDQFPRLTPSALTGLPHADHVIDVRYRLNLTGLSVGRPVLDPTLISFPQEHHP